MLSEFRVASGYDLVSEVARIDTRNRIRQRNFQIESNDEENGNLFADNEVRADPIPNPIDPENNIIRVDEPFEVSVLRKTILIRSTMCLIRMIFFFICLSFDNFVINNSIENIVLLLIFHEILILINFITYLTSVFIKRRNNENNVNNLSNLNNENAINSNIYNPDYLRKIVKYSDFFCNFLFFFWFLYGNYQFMFQKDIIIESIQENKFITYYITILILIGYFLYSRLIFVIIFSIIFGPCILFVLFDNYLKKRKIDNKINVRIILSIECFEIFATIKL